MVNFGSILGGAIAVSSLASFAVAHPGEKHDMDHVKRQIDARQLRAAAAKRSLSNCQNNLKHRELMQRSVQRRAQALNALREKRGINAKSKKFRRDLATLQGFEAISHNQTGLLDYTAATPESTIFAANTSCILAPEVTDGPYYVTGELIRKNVKESQVGVDLYLEAQYIDITTCEPVPQLYVDVWNCNATGVYSGVESGQAGLNTTFLRGVQETDEDGVASFETIFPGHYSGRAIHTHLLTKSNVSLYENGTTTGGAVTHIGQVFYPEALVSEVEATAPYNTNTQAYTSNDEDMWSIIQAEDDFDPFPQFIYLGDDITDGLLAWIQIGINATADYTDDDYYNVAATYQAGGGVANPDSGFGGGGAPGGNGTTNGTMPTGEAPSGAVPSGFATSTVAA
ncbi:aromatic compound dioxygenase [Melanomma pulvis-pyrius CBS 109.77]|uniref:Aromatic compound dioxygenase n=1 Tax=Melanomma pulvis-pyrius CBS 109.77 TaxID=1314802 RepID=A0A6A6XYX7_9PLEO|nr:aromatic compound dioxygenase [Melanomma pulvis-pyrius CBS 109.77]